MPAPASKQTIIDQLKKDLLVLQGFKPPVKEAVDTGLGPVLQAFPQERFPLGAVHEFIATSQEDTSATIGFITGLLSAVAPKGTAMLWISATGNIFPPALKRFGVQAQHIIFVHLRKHKDMLWVMEEALKCDALAAVVGEINDLNFTESRRLQLAVEQSRVTGFIIRKAQRQLQVTACIARWRITPIHSLPVDNLPGPGYPHWKVELLKIRNGQPGNWEIAWTAGRFQHTQKAEEFITELQKTA